MTGNNSYNNIQTMNSNECDRPLFDTLHAQSTILCITKRVNQLTICTHTCMLLALRLLPSAQYMQRVMCSVAFACDKCEQNLLVTGDRCLINATAWLET